jgi:hypothetical protein
MIKLINKKIEVLIAHLLTISYNITPLLPFKLWSFEISWSMALFNWCQKIVERKQFSVLILKNSCMVAGLVVYVCFLRVQFLWTGSTNTGFEASLVCELMQKMTEDPRDAQIGHCFLVKSVCKLVVWTVFHGFTITFMRVHISQTTNCKTLASIRHYLWVVTQSRLTTLKKV